VPECSGWETSTVSVGPFFADELHVVTDTFVSPMDTRLSGRFDRRSPDRAVHATEPGDERRQDSCGAEVGN
jgi:hypothetical protein